MALDYEEMIRDTIENDRVMNEHCKPKAEMASDATLRDYIAIHASDEDVTRIMIENFDIVAEVYPVTRQQARYIHADAMLSERAK